MVSVTTWNKGSAPSGTSGWQLTPDVRLGLESMNVIVPVASQAERDGLTPPLGKYVGMTVARNDVPGEPLEVWDGSAWNRQGLRVHAKTQMAGSGMAMNDLYSGTKRPWIQMGSDVVTTDSSGNASINYPVAFANGVISAVPCNGDSNTGNLLMSLAGAFTQTVSTLFVNVKTAHTGAVVASSTVRINWFAMGW